MCSTVCRSRYVQQAINFTKSRRYNCKKREVDIALGCECSITVKKDIKCKNVKDDWHTETTIKTTRGIKKKAVSGVRYFPLANKDFLCN